MPELLISVFHYFVEIKTNICLSLYFLFFRININHESFFHFLEIKRINIKKYFQIRGNEKKYIEI